MFKHVHGIVDRVSFEDSRGHLLMTLKAGGLVDHNNRFVHDCVEKDVLKARECQLRLTQPGDEVELTRFVDSSGRGKVVSFENHTLLQDIGRC